ncbi:hypothetical protein HMPREF2875_03030 [Corynebacterium sp. HMSC078H07]|nr:hypothetical protein HMPREF2875_03030 [Corynebacterium sp. HMSC078H07]
MQSFKPLNRYLAAITLLLPACPPTRSLVGDLRDVGRAHARPKMIINVLTHAKKVKIIVNTA